MSKTCPTRVSDTHVVCGLRIFHVCVRRAHYNVVRAT